MANIIKSINFGYAKDNLLRDIARMAAVESINFFKNSFVKGGFTDTSFKQWAKERCIKKERCATVSIQPKKVQNA
jgi:hypothetical protein